MKKSEAGSYERVSLWGILTVGEFRQMLFNVGSRALRSRANRHRFAVEKVGRGTGLVNMRTHVLKTTAQNVDLHIVYL